MRGFRYAARLFRKDSILNDNNSNGSIPPEEKPEQETEVQKAEREASMIKHRIAMLMDELKSCWQPEMCLTFIARSNIDPTKYSLLTEEKDFMEFLNWLNTAKAIMGNAATSDAVN